jgi:hypothetical protein
MAKATSKHCAKAYLLTCARRSHSYTITRLYTRQRFSTFILPPIVDRLDSSYTASSTHPPLGTVSVRVMPAPRDAPPIPNSVKTPHLQRVIFP